jgi:hypothetical protein
MSFVQVIQPDMVLMKNRIWFFFLPGVFSQRFISRWKSWGRCYWGGSAPDREVLVSTIIDVKSGIYDKYQFCINRYIQNLL